MGYDDNRRRAKRQHLLNASAVSNVAKRIRHDEAHSSELREKSLTSFHPIVTSGAVDYISSQDEKAFVATYQLIAEIVQGHCNESAADEETPASQRLAKKAQLHQEIMKMVDSIFHDKGTAEKRLSYFRSKKFKRRLFARMSFLLERSSENFTLGDKTRTLGRDFELFSDTGLAELETYELLAQCCVAFVRNDSSHFDVYEKGGHVEGVTVRLGSYEFVHHVPTEGEKLRQPRPVGRRPIALDTIDRPDTQKMKLMIYLVLNQLTRRKGQLDLCGSLGISETSIHNFWILGTALLIATTTWCGSIRFPEKARLRELLAHSRLPLIIGSAEGTSLPVPRNKYNDAKHKVGGYARSALLVADAQGFLLSARLDQGSSNDRQLYSDLQVDETLHQLSAVAGRPVYLTGDIALADTERTLTVKHQNNESKEGYLAAVEQYYPERLEDTIRSLSTGKLTRLERVNALLKNRFPLLAGYRLGFDLERYTLLHMLGLLIFNFDMKVHKRRRDLFVRGTPVYSQVSEDGKAASWPEKQGV